MFNKLAIFVILLSYNTNCIINKSFPKRKKEACPASFFFLLSSFARPFGLVAFPVFRLWALFIFHEILSAGRTGTRGQVPGMTKNQTAEEPALPVV